MVPHRLKILAALSAASTLFLSLPFTGAENACAAPIQDVEKNISEAVNTEASAQQKLDAWNEERDLLLEEARTLKYEMQWLELQRLKLQRYVAANDAKIAEMEEAQGRYAIIALELENSLLEEVDRMRASVEQSPPFLAEEREARLNFLRRSLDDPELSIGEKYRRVTEGLNAEVEYGKALAVTNEVARLDGESMDLIVVRAGRVGYYCLSMDRARGGIWNPDRGEFSALEGEALQAVQNIEMMSQTKQYFNFAVIPALQGVN